ncbi:MAG: ABC-2 family transporter protein [Chloroflexales bacterium]|nr:ABC-2 family transporter protein [Chloroflexales bacterium]
MKRYLSLFGLFVRASLQTALEYRANFVVSAFQSSFWAVWGVVGTLIFFRFTGSLGGWGFEQVLLVVGMYRLFEGIIDGLLRPNITRIVEHIQRGSLDFILLKPIDSQFMASLREINLRTLPDIAVGLGLIVYGLAALGRVPGPLAIGAFVLLVACAVVMVYGLWMLLITSAFWFVRVENVVELFSAVYETGRFPVTTFSAPVRAALTFIVPIAFLTTFPAAALLGLLDPLYLALAPILATVLLLASRAFWRVALRSYTSASS